LSIEPLEILDLFAGCGGWSYGFTYPEVRDHFHVKYAVDVEPSVEATYKRNIPSAKFILSDIMDLDPRDYADVDVVVGSPPCQLFSIGNNSNKARDPKEGMKLVKVFREWIKVIKPRYWIMENVKEIIDYLPIGKYPTRRILNTAYYGIPQQRERCFSGNYIVPTVTRAKHKTVNLLGKTLHKWITLREAIADLIEIPAGYVVTDQMGKKPMANSPYFSPDSPSRTVTTIGLMLVHRSVMYDKKKKRMRGGLDDVPEDDLYKKLTVRQLARLQGFPDGFEFLGESQSANYTMVGNAVPPLMARHFAGMIAMDHECLT